MKAASHGRSQYAIAIAIAIASPRAHCGIRTRKGAVAHGGGGLHGGAPCATLKSLRCPLLCPSRTG